MASEHEPSIVSHLNFVSQYCIVAVRANFCILLVIVGQPNKGVPSHQVAGLNSNDLVIGCDSLLL